MRENDGVPVAGATSLDRTAFDLQANSTRSRRTR
jgi:hypothetical protein